MSRIVMKFGGTSVADLDRIRKVAQQVKCEADDGNEVAVIVSAMAGVTDPGHDDLCGSGEAPTRRFSGAGPAACRSLGPCHRGEASIFFLRPARLVTRFASEYG